MATGAVMDISSVADAIEWQAQHAEANGAPGTAMVVRGLLAVLDGESATGRRIAGWQGLSLKDAMPLRIAGGLHNLLLSGEDSRLEPVYAGLVADQAAVDGMVRDLVETYDTQLLPWLDTPPQTNEAGRSASIVAGLLWLAQLVQSRFELLEIGSSAGVNTMLERFRFDLGGVAVGPKVSMMQMKPEWRGDPPPDRKIEIASIRGCDVKPLDLSSAETALRLKSYVWPEAAHRMARIDAASRMAAAMAPDVTQQDAGAFVVDALECEQEAGTTRVLFHSIVWQYVPDYQREQVEAAMAKAAERADAERPLAWLALETDPETFRHELTVRYWPGGGEPKLLAVAHPHGEWIEWLA